MHDPAPLEITLLTLLLTASLALAWLRLRRILHAVRASKSDADFSLTPVWPRIRKLVIEVLLQAKVIRHRPLPGLAHALVFWGFCAFALATVDHLAAGFGQRLIPDGAAWGRAYFGLAAGFAAFVSVAITGLALRRFLARPRWLGEVSPESGFVAFLIFLLMATYLVDYAGAAGANAAKAIWWIHTLALATFIPLIPHTKHLHLALSPFTIFFGHAGFSRIPPLAGDEDFGFDAGRDITRITALQAHTCVECGRCTEHCPAYNTGKELNPKEVILGLRRFLAENGPGAASPLLGTHLSQTAVFQCTTCGACEHQCPVGIQHLPAIIGLRRGAVNTGKWEDEHGGKLFLNLERTGNPLGISARERDKFIANAGLPVYDGTQEYCLWLGCMGAYDPQGRETIEAMARILNHLGITFGVLKKEKCTGDSARRLGNDLAFEELATYNLEQFQSKGVKKLLSICPHCVRTISEDWKEFGEAPPIEHHSEFLARHLGRPPQEGEGAVTFHDPCYLGRYRNTYDQPRRVASRGAALVEPAATRDRSFCCGAGGGLVFLGEEQGDRMSAERANQLIATGAATIAVACPFCHTMFRDALATTKDPPQLQDIAQLAAKTL